MSKPPIVVVGAGMAGLCAALCLTAKGFKVTVCEAAAHPGGKIRSCERTDMEIDVGPTVFTMAWVFDEILAPLNRRLRDLVRFEKLDVLAHHRWPDGSELDLYSDPARSAEAIDAFAGPRAAEQYRRFSRRAETVYEALLHTFMTRPQPGFMGLFKNAGVSGLGSLALVRPFRSLWQSLERAFDDERLRQLFARYATYYGSSPFRAPATLMLIAHVERLGVWHIEGGIRALTRALAELLVELGAELRFETEVTRLNTSDNRVQGVTLEGGEEIPADTVILNADINALATGKFGADVRASVAETARADRSLSAVTWAGKSVCAAPLRVHNVVFSANYRAEFDAILGAEGLPREPTVYLHAPDREAESAVPVAREERLFLLVNAAAQGDAGALSRAQTDALQRAVAGQLRQSGLSIDAGLSNFEITTPADFERRYPATGGALYGRATHHWMTPFQRSGSRTRLRGLYAAGGSVHPGAGVPMAAVSGKLAADRVVQDLG